MVNRSGRWNKDEHDKFIIAMENNQEDPIDWKEIVVIIDIPSNPLYKIAK